MGGQAMAAVGLRRLRRAVRACLLHIAEHGESELERRDILRALDEYWTESDSGQTR
jgi:hypothetical protein